MKCYVCGTEYSGDCCPVCEFEKVHVPGDKTREEVREILIPFIRKHAERFFAGVSVGIVLYQYTVGENVQTVDETEMRDVFDGLSLLKPGDTVWLNRTFGRLSDSGQVQVKLFVTANRKQVRDFYVTVPQIMNAEQLKIGLRAEKNACVAVAVQDEKGKTVFSEPCPLFS